MARTAAATVWVVSMYVPEKRLRPRQAEQEEDVGGPLGGLGGTLLGSLLGGLAGGVPGVAIGGALGGSLGSEAGSAAQGVKKTQPLATRIATPLATMGQAAIGAGLAAKPKVNPALGSASLDAYAAATPARGWVPPSTAFPSTPKGMPHSASHYLSQEELDALLEEQLRRMLGLGQ